MLSRPNMKHPQAPPQNSQHNIHCTAAGLLACLLATSRRISQYSVWMINAKRPFHAQASASPAPHIRPARQRPIIIHRRPHLGNQLDQPA